MSDSDSEKNEAEEEDEMEVRVMNRLGGYLKQFGLTPFSSNVAIGYLRSQLKLEGGQERFSRVMTWLLSKLNVKKQSVPVSDDDDDDAAADCEKQELEGGSGESGEKQETEKKNWQKGCPNLIPGLRAKEFWETDEIPWVKDLEALYPTIKREFEALRGKGAFQPYRSPVTDGEKKPDEMGLHETLPINGGSNGSSSSSEATAQSQSPSSKSTATNTNANANARDVLGMLATDRGAWNVSYLHLHGMDFEENLELCPETANAISSVVQRHYHHAFFSALAPDSHITAHYGPTNKKLRCHLPLHVGTGGAWLRVGAQRRAFQEGKCLVFDDSHEHEAANDDPLTPRVVLIVDFWHPDLSDVEVKFLSFLNKGQLNAAKRIQKARAQAQAEEDADADTEDSAGAEISGGEGTFKGAARNDDFLSVITCAKQGSVAEGDVWPYVVNDD